MNFAQYSPLALRTLKPLSPDQNLKHALLGLLTEVGELGDNIKRHVIYNKPLDKVNIMEECADIFWYLNLFMDQQGVPAELADAAALHAVGNHGSLAKMYAEDPFALVEAVLAIGGLTASLYVQEDEREVSNKKVVLILVSVLCSLLDFAGYTLSQCLETNINKLAARYGDKYSDYNALNRDTAAERAVLEGGNGTPS